MLGWTRGIATAVAAGIAGLLMWVAAALVDGQSDGAYWGRMGLLAAGGLLIALAQVAGPGTRPRLAPGFLLAGFLPVLVCAGWMLLYADPGTDADWVHRHVMAWSGDIGIRDLLDSLRPFVPVFAFGIGLTFGLSMEREVPQPVVADEAPEDEPLMAERTAVHSGRRIEGEPVARR